MELRIRWRAKSLAAAEQEQRTDGGVPILGTSEECPECFPTYRQADHLGLVPTGSKHSEHPGKISDDDQVDRVALRSKVRRRKSSTGGAYGVASGSRLLFRPRRVVGETFEVVVADGQDERGPLYLSIVRWFDVTLGGSPFEQQPFILFRNGVRDVGGGRYTHRRSR